MSITYLKVKIKSLAEESKIIRKEEWKAKKQYRYWANKQGGEREYRTANDLFWGLRNHRHAPVGRESRSALLAYGYLRGLKYSQIETKPTKEGKIYDRPDWFRVSNLVQKYGPEKDYDKVRKAIADWSTSL